VAAKAHWRHLPHLRLLTSLRPLLPAFLRLLNSL
jgi:hypothetical protein